MPVFICAAVIYVHTALILPGANGQMPDGYRLIFSRQRLEKYSRLPAEWEKVVYVLYAWQYTMQLLAQKTGAGKSGIIFCTYKLQINLLV